MYRFAKRIHNTYPFGLATARQRSSLQPLRFASGVTPNCEEVLVPGTLQAHLIAKRIPNTYSLGLAAARPGFLLLKPLRFGMASNFSLNA